MIYAGYIFTCLIGWLIVPKLAARLLERAAITFALGAFAISIEMFTFDLAGIGWNRWVLLLPWVLLLAYRIYQGRGQQGRGQQSRGQFTFDAAALPAWWRVGLVALALVPVAIWWPYERVMPLTSSAWDAWAIWLFKAKAFYLDRTIDPFLARAAEFTDHQPGYPLLMPLYGAFLYTLNGAADDYAFKMASVCFCLASLGVFHYLARRAGGSGPALVSTVMLASVPMLNVLAFELAGYVDTTLSLYLLAAGGFLYFWWRDGDRFDLAAASLAATAAAWTKNEGQFFLLAIVLLGVARLFFGRRPALEWSCLIAPPAALLLPWTIVRAGHGVEAAGFAMGFNFDPKLFAVAADALLTEALRWDLFVLTFVLLAAAALGAALLRMPAAFWILPGLVAWHLSGALTAYATGQNDLQWWLGTSADRILAQVVPLALLPAAVVFSSWIERQSADEPSAQKLESMPAPPGRREKRRRKSR